MRNLNGWQIVTLLGLLLAALVILVALGQEVSALVGAGLVVASALGVPIVQGAVNAERVSQVKELANGNLTSARQAVDAAHAQAAAERAEAAKTIQAMQQQMLALAALIPPDTKVPDFPISLD